MINIRGSFVFVGGGVYSEIEFWNWNLKPITGIPVNSCDCVSCYGKTNQSVTRQETRANKYKNTFQ